MTPTSTYSEPLPVSPDHAPPMRFPLPAIVFVVAAALAIIANAIYPLPWIGRPLADILLMTGIITIFGALWLVVAAIRAMARARTTV